MLNGLTRVVLVTVVAASLSARAGEPDYIAQKAAAVKLALRLVGDLARIAETHRSHYPGPELQTEIRELLKPLVTVDDLARFALLASDMARGPAEHQRYDSVFDYAQWACLYRIASIPGEEAHAALKYFLKPRLGRDGHPSEEFDELIAKQALVPKS